MLTQDFCSGGCAHAHWSLWTLSWSGRTELEPAVFHPSSLLLASLKKPACFQQLESQLRRTGQPSASLPHPTLSSQNTASPQPGQGNKYMSVSKSTRLQFGVKSRENHSISYHGHSPNVTLVKSLLIKTSPVNKPQAFFPPQTPITTFFNPY